MDTNSVVIIGRLTKDPASKTLNSGTVITEFSIASNGHKVQDKQDVIFLDCTAFGKTAEFVSKYLTKGKQVSVAGRLKQETWQGKDGKQNSKIKVIAEQVQALGSKSEGQERKHYVINDPEGNDRPLQITVHPDDIPF